MTSILRILDANLNRAREAARTLEDFARFVANDPSLCGRIKSIRHTLGAVEQAIGGARLLAARDTGHDVGKAIVGGIEYSRAGVSDVVTANAKRLQEALRVVEEYSKALELSAKADDQLALVQSIERARYVAYEVEQALAALSNPDSPDSANRFARVAALADNKLMLIVTESLCRHHSPARVIQGAMAAGVRLFQLREKDGSDRERLARMAAMRDVIRDFPIDLGGTRPVIIVNDRVDLALALDADGVHLGQGDLDVATARRIGAATMLIGRSCRALDDVRRAMSEGADYLGAGSMFATDTKANVVIGGPEWGVSATREASPVPVFCIGGISVARMGVLQGAFAEVGADVASGDAHAVAPTLRIAVSSAICASADPEAEAREMLGMLGGM